MNKLPEKSSPTPQAARDEVKAVRVVHISVQPKTWLGKLMLTLIGVAAVSVALVVSFFAAVVILCIIIVASVFLMWSTRRRGRIIDADARQDATGTDRR